MSDLHIDVGLAALSKYRLPAHPDCDCAIISGDICERATRAIKWIADAGFKVPAIYVPGNHDFYRTSRDRELEKARALASETPGISLLEQGVAVIAGARVVGATLWTDYRLLGEPWQLPAMAAAASGMNDHRLIRLARAGYRRWLPQDALAEHERSREYIEAVLREPFDGPTVIVTHHAPSARSIPERFGGRLNLLNAAYASDLEGLAARADLWVHGHVHEHNDYMIGECRVVSNPRGYVAFENTGFVRDWVIEVERHDDEI